MTRRGWWIAGFLTVTAAAVGAELYAAFDRSPDTVPWTDLLGQYVPWPVTAAAVALLVTWLPIHLYLRYHRPKGAHRAASRERLTMKGFRFQPVAWLTTVAAVLIAVTAATAAPPLDHVLSHRVTAWLGVATVVVTTVLGVVVHGRVTPTARPRDNDGRPLAPSTPPPAAPPTLPMAGP